MASLPIDPYHQLGLVKQLWCPQLPQKEPSQVQGIGQDAHHYDLLEDQDQGSANLHLEQRYAAHHLQLFFHGGCADL